MIKILFICHGNICRSPMAEFIFKDMVSKQGLSDRFYIASAATSTEEIWNGIENPVYPPSPLQPAAALPQKKYKASSLMVIGTQQKNRRHLPRCLLQKIIHSDFLRRHYPHQVKRVEVWALPLSLLYKLPCI